jgi:hypothetical protein
LSHKLLSLQNKAKLNIYYIGGSTTEKKYIKKDEKDIEEEIGDTTERKDENKSFATIILRYHHYARLSIQFRCLSGRKSCIRRTSIMSSSPVKLKKEEHSHDNDKRCYQVRE